MTDQPTAAHPIPFKDADDCLQHTWDGVFLNDQEARCATDPSARAAIVENLKRLDGIVRSGFVQVHSNRELARSIEGLTKVVETADESVGTKLDGLTAAIFKAANGGDSITKRLVCVGWAGVIVATLAILVNVAHWLGWIDAQ